MNKPIVAAFLWFMAIWLGVGLIGNLVGWPTDIGALLGAVVAAFVWTDPTGALWGPKAPWSNAPHRVSSSAFAFAYDARRRWLLDPAGTVSARTWNTREPSGAVAIGTRTGDDLPGISRPRLLIGRAPGK